MIKEIKKDSQVWLYTGSLLVVWCGLGFLSHFWQNLQVGILWGGGLLFLLVNHWRCLRCSVTRLDLDQELQRTLERCHQAERSWETTFDAVAAPITLLGTGRSILKANQAAAVMLGKESCELIGLRWKAYHNVGAYIVGAGAVPVVFSLKLSQTVYDVTAIDVS